MYERDRKKLIRQRETNLLKGDIRRHKETLVRRIYTALVRQRDTGDTERY